MVDMFERNIDYMRISVTDRCNLRCKYCMPNGSDFMQKDECLSDAEILRVCRAAAKNGIKTIKITGGEPLVRADCIELIRKIKNIDQIEYVTLTTNGTLLEKYLDALHEVGIDGINVSLDTLDKEIYKEITGFDLIDTVIGSIKKALELGIRVKINCVPLGEYEKKQWEPLVALAEQNRINIRFIEVMPIGLGCNFRPIKNAEILSALNMKYKDLQEDEKKHGFGPARYYKSEKLRGSIGFIGAMSHSFCTGCNRIRLTSDGFLKLCLYSEDGCNVKELMRNGCGDEALSRAILDGIRNKPEKHAFDFAKETVEKRMMSKIGG